MVPVLPVVLAGEANRTKRNVKNFHTLYMALDPAAPGLPTIFVMATVLTQPTEPKTGHLLAEQTKYPFYANQYQ